VPDLRSHRTDVRKERRHRVPPEVGLDRGREVPLTLRDEALKAIELTAPPFERQRAPVVEDRAEPGYNVRLGRLGRRVPSSHCDDR